MGDGTRERDLVLAPNEFAYISDQTKGNINVYVGPYKTSMANTDRPVVFNEETKRFERCPLEPSMQVFPTAPEGWYLVLKNPARDGAPPKTGTVSNLPELEVGHKVNIPGPISFALWPGQMVRVLKGHHLRSNQYLLVRVYDEESAKAHWDQAVIKPQAGGEAPPVPSPDLTIGKHLVIKGTEVSFYIPPTGIEVVRDPQRRYVREAVTLERLEYCVLLDEDGNKRFIRGPAVVFPKPTETFVVRRERRKFRAVELNEISGIYVKVIAPYAEGERRYEVGDELFITGKEQMIYFPRPEHALIKYGAQEIHYAVAIPAGEARYCLDRQTGQIRLVRGPLMFLPDPRREVIVRRVLDPHQAAMWFPGNEEALEVNRRLKEETRRPSEAGERRGRRKRRSEPVPAAEEEAAERYAGEDFQRKTTHTAPRTVTLDTKYEGAVSISVWTGYAILVVSKTGERRVIVGPQTHLLEYDETLEPLELSTGTPKSDERLLRTVYLRVLHNKISDVVVAETVDLVRVSVRLSYRVNFTGEPERWFHVENFVKFLTDHMRSLLRNAVKHRGIEEFYANSIDVVRDAVLGTSGADGKRPGRLFEENGMQIYDVEVLDVTIGEASVAQLLVEAQQSAFSQTLQVAAERRRHRVVEQTEAVKREIAQSEAQTRFQELELHAESVRKRHDVAMSELRAKDEFRRAELASRQAAEEALAKVEQVELSRRRANSEQELEVAERQLDQRLREAQAEVQAVVDKAQAISPELIAALQAFSDRALTERVAESMAPLAILGGKSVAEVLATLLQGTPLAEALGRSRSAEPPQLEG